MRLCTFSEADARRAGLVIDAEVVGRPCRHVPRARAHGNLGPSPTTADEIDPSGLRQRTWVNGALRRASSAGHLVFDCATLESRSVPEPDNAAFNAGGER